MDATASMAWRWENNISKLEYATNLLAAFAAMHIRNQDKVGLLLYDANDIHQLPPRSRKNHLDRIFATLAAVKPGSADSFPVLVKSLSDINHHRGRMIICSDLEENEEKIEAAMHTLAGLEDEIILVHLLDKAEVELPFDYCTHLEDAESGELVPVHFPSLKKEHETNLKAFRDYWQERAKEWGIMYYPADTSMNYVDLIIDLLESHKNYFS